MLWSVRKMGFWAANGIDVTLRVGDASSSSSIFHHDILITPPLRLPAHAIPRNPITIIINYPRMIS